jgi:hypothetical protein
MTNFVDNINERFEKEGRGRKIVLDSNLEGYKPEKGKVTGYYINYPTPMNRNGKDLLLKQIEVFYDFPLKEDSIILRAPHGFDYNNDSFFYRVWTPSLSSYGFSDKIRTDWMKNVVNMVNDSMEYDMKSAADKIAEGNKGMANLEELTKAWIEESQYRPTGKETMKGVCKEAGLQIRKILQGIPDLRIEYCNANRINKNGLKLSHDITFAYNPKNLEWVILNSKSPYFPFDIVPKEKLKEI